MDDDYNEEAYETTTVDPPKDYLLHLTIAYSIVLLCIIFPLALIARCCLRWCKRRQRRNQEWQQHVQEVYYHETNPSKDPEASNIATNYVSADPPGTLPERRLSFIERLNDPIVKIRANFSNDNDGNDGNDDGAIPDEKFVEYLDKAMNKIDEIDDGWKEMSESVLFLDEDSKVENVPFYETNVLEGGKKDRKSIIQLLADEGDEEDDDDDDDNPFKQFVEESEIDRNAERQSHASQGQVKTNSRGCCSTLWEVLACNKESRKIAKLSIPACASSSVSEVVSALKAGLIAYNLGPNVYVAYAMVYVFLDLAGCILGGITEAQYILSAQAVGMERYFQAAQYSQLARIIFLLLGIPLYLTMRYFIHDIMLYLGFEYEIAIIAKLYIPYAIAGNIIETLVDALSELMWLEERGVTITIFDIVFHVLGFAGVYVGIIYFGFDLIMIGYLDVALYMIYGLFLWQITLHTGWLEDYQKGLFHSWSLKNGQLVKGLLKMAWPLSLGDIMTNGEWQILTFLVASMGSLEVAAWSITAEIWSVLEHLPSGVREACDIRIPFHLGRNNPEMAKISAYKCLLTSTCIAVAVTLLLFEFQNDIISYFTDNAELGYLISSLIPLLGIGNIINVVGSNAYTILTSQSRAKLVTFIWLCCAWLIGVPVAIYFVLGLNYGLQPLLWSVLMGYATASMVILFIVFTSNWSKLSEQIRAKADKVSNKSKSQKDLPAETELVKPGPPLQRVPTASSKRSIESDLGVWEYVESI